MKGIRWAEVFGTWFWSWSGLGVFLLLVVASVVSAAGRGPEVRIVHSRLKPWMQEKVESAIPLLERVLLSDEFENRVLHYRGKRSGRPGFESDHGLGPAGVLASLREAREQLGGVQDGVLELSLADYWRPTRTIGFTVSESPTIHLNRHVYRDLSLSAIAGNLIHEGLHKLGFEHSYEPVPGREDTVPYAIGDLVAELATWEEKNAEGLINVQTSSSLPRSEGSE
jgi:hypothetical protein